MVLTDVQQTAVKQWVDEGCGLSEIQRRMASEFGLAPTFMDVRFTIIDLGLTIKEAPTPSRPAAKADDALTEPADASTPAGSVSVSVDRVVKPGAVMSGSVTFTDGRQASWMLDQLGRLALDAGDPAYRPSEGDLRDFQKALQDALQRQGF